MKNIKYYSLICFFIIFSCLPFNISAQENKNVLVEARDELKFESVIERTKKSVVLLSMNPNVDPETDPRKVDYVLELLLMILVMFSQIFIVFIIKII